MPDDTDSTDIDDTNAAWRRFWQGRSWNFLILGLSFPWYSFFPLMETSIFLTGPWNQRHRQVVSATGIGLVHYLAYGR